MLVVTEAVKVKFKETLIERSKDPEEIIRAIISTSDPNKIEFVLSKEEEGDQVIKSEEGEKILVIGSNLAPTLEGMVLDYQENF